MLIVVLMRSNIVIVGLLAGLSLAVGCATDEDYYEGEIVPTRPISKPSLDPNQPAELTGSTAPTGVPGINESKQPGVAPQRDQRSLLSVLLGPVDMSNRTCVVPWRRTCLSFSLEPPSSMARVRNARGIFMNESSGYCFTRTEYSICWKALS